VFLLTLFSVPPLFAQKGEWRKSFPVDKKDLGTPVDNPYFFLTPAARLHYRHGKAQLTRTVINVPKTVDSIAVVVVEDREERDGKLVEVTRDYYALDKTTQDVYYFGEDVNNYEAGKGVSHEGSWLSGADGASFGLIMPGELKVGDKFYEELGPNTGLDRGEIVGTNEKVKTPAGTFEHCVHVKETSPKEKGAVDHKWYAPGIGLIKDKDLVLVKVEEVKIAPVDFDDKH
jgi:hypothetical protein